MTNTLTVTKIEAAESQLCEAIRLFFEERDPISIHTLAGAANGILESLAEFRGLSFPLGKNSDYIKDEYRKEWIVYLNKAKNFFKHADRDPGGVLEFKLELNTIELFSAIALHGLLAQRYLPETAIFFAWFSKNYPEMLMKDATIKDPLLKRLTDNNIDFSNKSLMREAINGVQKQWPYKPLPDWLIPQ